jgi:hypothetical protein
VSIAVTRCREWPLGALGRIPMSVVAILGVVAAALVLLSLAGAKLLMRKFDRIYSGLE